MTPAPAPALSPAPPYGTTPAQLPALPYGATPALSPAPPYGTTPAQLPALPCGATPAPAPAPPYGATPGPDRALTHQTAAASANGGVAERGLVICAALRIEALAVRAGLPGPSDVRVVRTGFGPSRAVRAAGRLPGFGALAVTGFGGAADDGLRPGDVLVASEIRFGGAAVPCPSAGLLARDLANAGLAVQMGPLATCDHIVTGGERGRLAGRGARAVDMESGPLALAAGGLPFAVVRVIVDTPAFPLLSAATLRRGPAACRALRRVSWVLARHFALPKEVGS
ncbi:hypothetical protein N5079_29070 [Planotetraspora sp. A-T 1434]|uniref:phosphorylase family protein n=1 Tax=Planotetraspora sp. A-T 1434 TaxID=2979219 RepID=UPI0021C17499|nr:hypothetical protein [Planotetraspora sp. A-T 1434]MCT9934261.1 hypothetical protein [Planotetraspora sp. A-T 1434]